MSIKDSLDITLNLFTIIRNWCKFNGFSVLIRTFIICSMLDKISGVWWLVAFCCN